MRRGRQTRRRAERFRGWRISHQKKEEHSEHASADGRWMRWTIRCTGLLFPPLQCFGACRERRRDTCKPRRCWYPQSAVGWLDGSRIESAEYARCSWRFFGLQYLRSFRDWLRITSSCWPLVRCWASVSAENGRRAPFFLENPFALNIAAK